MKAILLQVGCGKSTLYLMDSKGFYFFLKKEGIGLFMETCLKIRGKNNLLRTRYKWDSCHENLISQQKPTKKQTTIN